MLSFKFTLNEKTTVRFWSLFAIEAQKYTESTVTATMGDTTVNGKSIMDLIALGGREATR